MPFRSKDAAVSAILANRSAIEDCCCNGTTSSLMAELNIPTAKVYKEFCIARNAERMETDSQHDLVGYTIQAVANKELDDRHLLAITPNELNPKEKFEIYASDLHTSHLASGGDKSLMDCPYIAPKGQKAKDLLTNPDSETLANPETANSSGSVLDDLERCVGELSDFELVESAGIDTSTASGSKMPMMEKLKGYFDSHTDSEKGLLESTAELIGDTASIPRKIVMNVLRAVSSEQATRLDELAKETGDTVNEYLKQLDEWAERLPGVKGATTIPIAVFKTVDEAGIEQVAGMVDTLTKQLNKHGLEPVHSNMSKFDAEFDLLDERLDAAEQALEGLDVDPPRASASANQPQVASSGDTPVDHKAIHTDYLTARANMETMILDHGEMVKKYELRMQQADSMMRTHKSELRMAKQEAAANRDRHKSELRVAKQEAAANRDRLERVVSTVKKHLGEPAQAKAPTKAAAKTPTKAPTKAAAKTPTKAPTKAAAKALTKAPTKAAAKALTKAAAKAPTKAAAKHSANVRIAQRDAALARSADFHTAQREAALARIKRAPKAK